MKKEEKGREIFCISRWLRRSAAYFKIFSGEVF